MIYNSTIEIRIGTRSFASKFEVKALSLEGAINKVGEAIQNLIPRKPLPKGKIKLVNITDNGYGEQIATVIVFDHKNIEILEGDCFWTTSVKDRIYSVHYKVTKSYIDESGTIRICFVPLKANDNIFSIEDVVQVFFDYQ